MKSIQRITGIFMTVIVILALSCTAGFARVAPQGVFDNADVIVLTENHIREVAFDLDGRVGSSGGLHSIYILSAIAGQATTGVLSITFAYGSPLTKGDEVVYFIAGGLGTAPVIGFAPVLQYVYATGGSYGFAVPVSKYAFGALLVGVLYANVDFPVTILATVKLVPGS